MSETVEDIIAEMRERAWKWTENPEFSKILEEYADRLEDANVDSAMK